MLELSKKQTLELFDKISFFEHLTDEEKGLMASFKTNIAGFANGQNIIRQGDLDRAVYVLLKGKAHVSRKEKSNVKINILKPGDIFGEISFFSNRPRSTNVVAEGNVMALKMDWSLIEELSPSIKNKIKDKLIDVVIQRLDEINKILLDNVRF
ncbi:MAG: cyclic nucleotide-binding domain-containing protein [Nitrospinae bacterium]|nr:cyclic nucleotide-binding domain-containing protein [Nitrospinota bacterium]